MMKKMKFGIILVIVALAYFGLWMMIKPSEETPTQPPKVETPPVEAPAPGAAGENETAGEKPSSAENDQTTAVDASQNASRGVMNASTPFAYGRFIDDPGDLPKQLEARIKTECRSGVLVDLSSRRILWKKDATVPYAIASMSKIMTAFELMCEVQAEGSKVTLETSVKVPQKMFRKFSDCHIYMDPRESFTVDELLKCMMIHSANDCAYLLGDFLAGSEEAFVAKMNARAKALGLNSLSFCNTNGLPDKKNKRANKGSAIDMAYLSEYVMDVPEIMKWAGTKLDAIREGTTRKFDLANKNHLLGSVKCPGINGLKTGYIDDSKFCITVTCERNGRRMICVVMGSEKAKIRDNLVIALLNWGYSVE